MPSDEKRERDFTSLDAVRGTSATASQIEYFVRRGLIRPKRDARRRGMSRTFSLLDIVEIELASRLNRFRIPTPLIGDALFEFRWHHRVSVALYLSQPPGQIEVFKVGAHAPLIGHPLEVFSPAQQEAVRRLWVDVANRRSKKNARDVASTLFDVDGGMPSDVQKVYLTHAFNWRMHCHSRECRKPFIGLFVFPEGNHAMVADEPIDLDEAVTDEAVVVNLGAVLTAVEDRLKLFDVMDELFRAE
jgi:hypothetical protein